MLHSEFPKSSMTTCLLRNPVQISNTKTCMEYLAKSSCNVNIINYLKPKHWTNITLNQLRYQNNQIKEIKKNRERKNCTAFDIMRENKLFFGLTFFVFRDNSKSSNDTWKRRQIKLKRSILCVSLASEEYRSVSCSILSRRFFNQVYLLSIYVVLKNNYITQDFGV